MAAGLLGACAPPEHQNRSGEGDLAEARAAVSSEQGTLLLFSFEGRVLSARRDLPARAIIEHQLLYTIGQLNGRGGVSSPATLRLLAIEEGASAPPPGEPGRPMAAIADSGPREIRYHAELPVAWPSKSDIPSSLRLILPLRVDEAGEALLRQTSAPACFDLLSESALWYDYRPENPGCAFLAPMIQPIAAVSPGERRSSGRYPELDRLWEDGALDVLAIFRKDVPGSTYTGDVGRKAYVGFVESLLAALGPEASVRPRVAASSASPSIPSLDTSDLTISRTYPDGRRVNVVVLLEDVVAPPDTLALLPAYSSFLHRYTELGPTADVVLYEGHSGLGRNIRAITDQAAFLPGRYQLFYLDTCDSFAYLSDDFAERRGALTPDDPEGTQNLDVLVNAMPATFAGMPAAAMSIVEALLPDAEPRTFEGILQGFDRERMGFVKGDEDNPQHPSSGSPPAPLVSLHTTIDEQTTQITTPLLPRGELVFELGPDWEKGQKSGALSLEARVIGRGASQSRLSCQGSSSTLDHRSSRCVVELAAEAKIELTLASDRPSDVSLVGFARRRPSF